MKIPNLNIVILGLSITSSWGNGHATTYRGLVRELAARGHRVLFLERDVPWYRANRDLAVPPFGRTELYADLKELKSRFRVAVRNADFVMVGSYVPEGIAVGKWIVKTAQGPTAFYDIDTPVTIAGLENGSSEYLSRELMERYDLYLSFTGGPILQHIMRRYGVNSAKALYCSVDTGLYYPDVEENLWDFGYLGTHSEDRQSHLDLFMLKPARMWRNGRFVVAGALYPDTMIWPYNINRIEHVPPHRHRSFYNRQRFTLNITRAPMIRAGFSPSVRLFEAAACGVPIISDKWEGLDTFFEPGKEILVADSADDVLSYLRELEDEKRILIGRRARARVRKAHTAFHRAMELEGHIIELLYGNGANRNTCVEL